MKIHNKQPIGNNSIRKAKKSSTNGVFGKILESESSKVQAVADTPHQDSQSNMKEAWHTLEESVSLLDQAMQCLEAGSSPSEQLIGNIEQLRSQLRQQLASGRSASELKQADTLLAVEAERIRAMQS